MTTIDVTLNSSAVAQSSSVNIVLVTMTSSAVVTVSDVPQVMLDVLMQSAGVVTAAIPTVQTLLSALVQSNAVASGAFTPQMTLQAVMTAVASMTSMNADDGSATVWVVNTKNGGTTRYANFPFNSFAKIGASYYGVKRDGLYKLDGPSDAGAPIAAAVNLGNNNFDTSKEKSLSNCYLGVASNGAVVLKVVANGQTYYYTARNSSTVLETQRIDLGKGLRANYFELELQNYNGGAFELESIEFTPIPLSRRI